MFYAPVSGGVRTYLDTKIQHFAHHPVRHTMVISGPRAEITQTGRTTIHRIPGPPVPFTPGYRFLLSARALRRILRAERPHVIEVGSPFFVPLILRRAMGRDRIPTVGFYHADLVRTYAGPLVKSLPEPAKELARAWTRMFVRRVFSRFDATVAASDSVVRELRELGLGRVEKISLGVDLDLFHPRRRSGKLREALAVKPGVPVALFAGRLCPEKELDVVVRAHAQMDPEFRPHLVLVGEGPSTPGLEREARTRRDLTVLPVVADKEELAGIYADADLYLAAGPGETFGLAVAEAMASGLPLVGVESGAVRDHLVASGAGISYRARDVASCRAALEELTTSRAVGLGEKARAWAEGEFNWEDTFQSLLTLYRDLARRPNLREPRVGPETPTPAAFASRPAWTELPRAGGGFPS